MLNKTKEFLFHHYDADSRGKMLSSLLRYINKRGAFTHTIFEPLEHGLPADIWWKDCIDSAEDSLLKELALRLLSMPASSAAAERNWSAFSFVHSRLRNRLMPDKVEKLVYIFFNKKLQDKEDFDDSYF